MTESLCETQPSLELRGRQYELTVPVRGDLARDGFYSASVLLDLAEICPRIIERQLRALGWSRSTAKHATNILIRKFAPLLPPACDSDTLGSTRRPGPPL